MEMFTKRLAKLIEWLLIAGGGFMVVMVCLEVILRYCFGSSLFFTEELSRYIMIWIVFLGTALLIYELKHINIDVITSKLSPKGQTICALFSQITVALFCIFLAIEGTHILPMQLEQEAVSMPLSMFWFYLCIPLSAALCLIFLAAQIMKTLSDLKNFKQGGSD